MSYAVIRTDLMSGTKQPADLVSLRFYDSNNKFADVENGVIAKLSGYEDKQREVMKAVAATSSADLNDCVVIAGVELMYDERKHNLDEFINEAGRATRGYILRSRNMFSITTMELSTLTTLFRLHAFLFQVLPLFLFCPPFLFVLSILDPLCRDNPLLHDAEIFRPPLLLSTIPYKLYFRPIPDICN